MFLCAIPAPTVFCPFTERVISFVNLTHVPFTPIDWCNLLRLHSSNLICLSDPSLCDLLIDCAIHPSRLQRWMMVQHHQQVMMHWCHIVVSPHPLPVSLLPRRHRHHRHLQWYHRVHHLRSRISDMLQLLQLIVHHHPMIDSRSCTHPSSYWACKRPLTHSIISRWPNHWSYLINSGFLLPWNALLSAVDYLQLQWPGEGIESRIASVYSKSPSHLVHHHRSSVPDSGHPIAVGDLLTMALSVMIGMRWG